MEVGKVMNSLGFGVHQDSKSTVKFTDEIKAEDMAAFFIQNGIINYTAKLQRRNLQLPYLTKASAILYRIDLPIKRNALFIAHTQRVIVKCVMDPSPYKQLKRATRELYIWSRYKHVNILPLLGFAILNGKLAMISPWIENGSVTEYVKKQHAADYYGLCTQLSCAINYLHTNGVIHGDIKGDNVLVSDEGIVKVMDFGVSIMAQLRIEFTHTGVGRGTERWQAPEILRRKTDSTKEGDIYALGMTIIEIYTHDRPYGDTDIGHDEKCEIIAAFWALLERCWSGDPAARPTSDEIYKQLVTE
ncbi:unnamed protein product [Rhizoctonia solani]|uniref:Protein kinase domain-containing protein n=1 Tax=Rhizoctonia solani TaxID=456999 RepID=A0A8H2X9V8_9AGAM|nr:unnamed protein product [Rhizoctonia solani]